MAPFLGMRGTGDFTVSGQRPENWRETMLFLYPNGMAPLTAMMAKLKSESTDDPKFHWYQKVLPSQRATITGIYTDVLNTAYVNGGALGDTVYVKMSAADVAQFRPRHQIVIRDASDSSMFVTAKVTAATANGASSYLTCTLLEADDNSSAGDMSDADVCFIIGTVNEEGAKSTNGIQYDPDEYYNLTQIFRSALSATRTASKTRLRTGDQVKEAKREALELHSIEMEKAFLFGERSERTGSGGKPERTTRGIRNWISTNKADYLTEAGSATWIAGGRTWFDNWLEQLFRFGSTEKIAYAGSGAILGIQNLAFAGAQYQMKAMEGSYGIKVVEWVTPFGTLYLKSHPLFTYEATLRNSMCVVDPNNLIYRYIDDTKYKPQIQDNDLDGELSEYLTEAGLELHFEQSFGWLDNVGVDRA